ncbi:MAG: hypothetical protein D8M18_09395, partial [Bacteroidetes bacterium]|nr:hypothetical protein [Bacteroidota bacterium]
NEVAGLQFAANFEEEPPTLADTVPTSCTTPTRFTFSALRAVSEILNKTESKMVINFNVFIMAGFI